MQSIWHKFLRRTHSGRKFLGKLVIVNNISVSSLTIVSFKGKAGRLLCSSCVKIRIKKNCYITVLQSYVGLPLGST